MGEVNDPRLWVKVRVHNLAFAMEGKDQEFEDFFKECGEIVCSELISRRDGSFAGVGLLTFKNQASAEAAVAFDNSDLYGRQIRVAFAEEKSVSEKPPGCNTVWIGNLNYDINDDVVRGLFENCGEITQIRWPREFTNWGHVEFLTTEAADKAIFINGQKVLGKGIKVDFAANTRR